MKNKNKLGIWMDHSAASLVDLKSPINNQIVTSKFTHELEEEAIQKSENLMHNKRQQKQEAFYKEISEKILNYNHVVLFGPTNAKTELDNYLKEDLNFKNIKIFVEAAEKMTDNQKDAFVKKYFEKYA